MRAIKYIILALFLLVNPVFATDHYVDTTCSDGTAYDPATPACTGGSDIVKNAISDINSIDFADGDSISFRKGQTITDATLTFASVTNGSSKTLTVTAHGTGNLPVLGSTTRMAIYVQIVGLSLVVKDINADGQINGDVKIWFKDFGDLTLDNIEMDGSVGYNTGCTPDSDCYETTAISFSGGTGTVEIKNFDIRNWGGDEDIWVLNKPAYTGTDRHAISINSQNATFLIHDGTITHIEADGIILERTNNAHIYGVTTIWNCGENSIDNKGSTGTHIEGVTMGRDATWTGIGGSSTGLTVGAIMNVQDLETGIGYASDNIEINDNVIGPADIACIGLKSIDGHVNDGINIHHNCIKQGDPSLDVRSLQENVRVHNNILDGVATNGFFAFVHYTTIPANPPVFYNNTFYLNSGQGAPGTYKGAQYNALFWIYDDNAGSCVDPLIINNIFHINDNVNYILYHEAACSPTLDHNNWYNENAGTDEIIMAGSTGYGEDDQASWISAGHAGAVFGDPGLNNPANDNFALTVRLTAVNLGNTYKDGLSPTTTWSPINVVTVDRDIVGWDKGAMGWDLSIYNPTPIADATDVNVNIDPSWTNPGSENTNDGYFKVGACPTDAGDSVWTNQAHKTSYDPGELATDTLHCWKVDIDHDGGTETGTNREFRTAEGPPPQEEHLTKIEIKSGGTEIGIKSGGFEIIVGQ